MSSIDLATLHGVYNQRKVDGRSNLCPRRGVYRIKRVEPLDWACRKPATIAICQWKPSLSDPFHPDFEVGIQIQSLRLNCSAEQFLLLCDADLVGMEINITYASYDKLQNHFLVRWAFV